MSDIDGPGLSQVVSTSAIMEGYIWRWICVACPCMNNGLPKGPSAKSFGSMPRAGLDG